MDDDFIPLGSDQLPESSGLETVAMMDAETDGMLVDGTVLHGLNAPERAPSSGPQDYPAPPALLSGEEFAWDKDQPTAERYQALGRRLRRPATCTAAPVTPAACCWPSLSPTSRRDRSKLHDS